MKATNKHNERMAKIIFASVYPYYIKKVESKGSTITANAPLPTAGRRKPPMPIALAVSSNLNENTDNK